MNYQNIYNQLISKRQNKTFEGYGEKHHIIPKSLGGSDHKSNIVKLTAREHFIAHRLLAKIHGGKMWYALFIMSQPKSKSAKGVSITSRTYQIIKENDAKVRSKMMTGDKNHFYGKTFTYDQLQKLKGDRPSIKGEKNPNYGKKTSDATIAIANYVKSYNPREVKVDYSVMEIINKTIGIIKTKITDARDIKSKKQLELGRYIRGLNIGAARASQDIKGNKNPNYKNGQAIIGKKNPMYGKEHKESTKLKIGEKAKRRITCPHCEKVGSISNMKRWHFDNCKEKNGN